MQLQTVASMTGAQFAAWYTFGLQSDGVISVESSSRSEPAFTRFVANVAQAHFGFQSMFRPETQATEGRVGVSTAGAHAEQCISNLVAGAGSR